MQLKELQIEGFRGIKEPVIVPLEGQVIVVSGPNGSGKTSIFQAVEWCLFGRLDFVGTEFQREDAIVNDFHLRNEAQVTLTLDDGTIISRTRKKKAKTGLGTRDSQLRVTRDGMQVEGDEAQALITDLLALTADEFRAVAHLPQETIRSFIQGSPAERSETIDKMIGLFHMRELITGLDPTMVDSEIEQLEKRAAVIENSMIQATIFSREMVRNQEETLERAGIPRDQMTEAGMLANLQQISSQVAKLAEDLEVQVPALGPLSAETARDSVRRAKEAVRGLGERRFERFSQTQRMIEKLNRLQYDLEHATKELESLAGVDVKTLAAQRDTAAARKEQLEERLAKLNTRSSRLSSLQHRITAAEDAVRETATRLKSLGTVEQAQAELRKIREEIKGVMAEAKTARALETLLPAAAEYLQTAQPDRCPVCQQVIADVDVEVERLQREVLASDEAKRTQKLEKQRRAFKEMEQQQEGRIAHIEEAKKELSRRQKELEAAKTDLEKVVGTPPTEPLPDFVAQQLAVVAEEINSIQEEISKTDITVATIDGQLRSLKEEQDQLRRCRKQIAKELDISLEVEDLATPLQNRIAQAQQQLTELEGLASAFAPLEGVIDRADGILGVLEARERLAELEREYPTALKEKEALQRAIGELNDLKLGLQDIYQAATEHQRSVVGGALATLQPVINARYSRLIGHPEYAELQIEPEEQKKGVYRYWIAARNSARTHSTYVSTRFSTSQRNVAAVAIFLAMAEHLPHDLNVLMMDDPTQSMDPEHRRAMAHFLAEEGTSKQVIVGTHPAFAEMLVQSSEKALHYQLKPWTPTEVLLE